MKRKALKILVVFILVAGGFFARGAVAEALSLDLSYVPFGDGSFNVISSVSPDSSSYYRCNGTGWNTALYGNNLYSGAYNFYFRTGILTSNTTYDVTCQVDSTNDKDSKSITVIVGSSGCSGGDCDITTSDVSNITVGTGKAVNVTYTTATLTGSGGYKTPSSLPLTAYFRYSRAAISPIYCNDIYGNNMLSTKDITRDVNGTPLGTSSSQTFSQNIINLTPDTLYYYCAIISNKNNIAYGGESIVKSFRTIPFETTIRSTNTANIKSVSAQLNGSFNSVGKVTTSFQYKRVPTDGTSTNWSNELCRREHNIETGQSNVFGNIKCELSDLTPNVRYQFRTIAKTSAGTESKTIYGNTLSFTTIPVSPDAPSICPNGWTGIYPNCTPPGIGGTCFTGWTGVWPDCVPPVNINVCPANWTGVYPNCNPPISCPAQQTYSPATNSCVTTAPSCSSTQVYNPSTNSCVTPPTNDFCETNPTNSSCLPGPGWTWNPGNGTWNGGNWNGGTWTGGSWNNGVWSGGVWNGAFGTWSGGTWSNGVWTGGSWSEKLTVGQTATPPADAIVRSQEGIEHVFVRQILANPEFAQRYGYEEGASMQTFAWDLADEFARAFGYISVDGREIRVSFPDVAAYQLQMNGNQLTVYEYYYNQIVDVRDVTTVFKDASGYEYYFKK